jgi:predicted metalloprotease
VPRWVAFRSDAGASLARDPPSIPACRGARGRRYRGRVTFNDKARIDSSKVRRRGRTTGIAAGGGGLLVIALIVVSQLTGVNLLQFADTGGGGGASTPDEAISGCETGADANADLDCRITAGFDSIDTYWEGELPALGVAYSRPAVGLFSDRVSTGCGGATSATGPFYCPADATIYLDTSFYAELRTRFGSSGGPLAELYVLAHEYGHHVQNIGGITQGLDLQATGPESDSVRLEVQADCFAGAWVGAASTTLDENGEPFLLPITDEQVADALSAAAAVGDDRIQEAATGEVNPEAFTHGTSAQRQQWFETGRAGGPQACDTFGGAL